MAPNLDQENAPPIQVQDLPVLSTNAFYMHPSENVGSSIVPVLFDGSGYRSWRRGVLRALLVKNKTGFINGKIVKPDPDSGNFAQWERCDDMVTSWLLNSLSKDLADSLQYVKNAKELWDELTDRYDQTNGAKLYQLQREIAELTQENLDVTGYYTKMRRLWEELTTLDTSCQCTCSCTCGGKTKMYKAEQDRQLIHFHMGLNEVYTVIRGSILMMNRLPTMAQAFSILVQEEKQREVKPHGKFNLESTSLHVNAASTSTNFKTNYAPSKSNWGSNSGSSNWGNNSGGSRPPNKSYLFCDYCKNFGHTREKCFRLHGFPEDSKFTKGKNVVGTAAAAHKGKGHEGSEDRYHEKKTPMLTKQHLEQLVSLLENIQVQGGNNNANTARDAANNIFGGAANFAGPFNEEPSGDW
ncbi:hypothetical protein KY290_036430 [Solanum tuberosum]|uniref:Retrotransposon Copia-like N-terminal domain-containing protein n=1 Tax=Solanum tuberosum TaxID=4113 RepID=A0ABQ7TT53_SOLTU|nr:hypothetical protein KY289_035954 [Solanum tuberosum]KAH0737725.1 hypothetical protein KY290_036430 [Solanum tuberosum]